MKATNQGFIDLHTPFGFMLVGACFILVTALIILGAVLAKSVAAKERLQREKLKAELEHRKR